MRRLAACLTLALIASLVPVASEATSRGSSGLATGSDAAKASVGGLLVSSSTPLTSVVLTAIERLLGRTVTGTTPLGGSLVSVRFDRDVPASTVRLVTPLLALLHGITGIEPDLRATVDAAPNDTYFAQQGNLWGSDTPGVSAASDTTPAPDYSVHAPSLWRSTVGSKKVVVAVVDGGIVPHPDLTGQTVAGYDMITDPRVARDGNGRDADPTDKGNWSDGTYCQAGPSTWHGTHVAGIIAAKRDNGIGISGIAPGVAIQPVRVMGLCGGLTSDIIAGIRWASGGTVTGVPANKTPAKVINVSLSSASDTCPQAYQDVIDEARSRGSLVVVSAGNEHALVQTRTPANCVGVFSVGASAPDGRRTTYSNAGATLGIVAPGGQLPSQGPGIWSTVGVGSTTLTGSSYVQYSGTSMAAPTVSAAAALIDSLGTFSPDQVAQILSASAKAPPTYGGDYDCRALCGAGLLNLAGVPAPIGQPVLAGTPLIGQSLSFVPGDWNGHPDDVTYEWLRDGVVLAGQADTSYPVTAADLGRVLSVRSTAHAAGFPDVSGLSVPFTVPKASSSVSLKLSATKAKLKSTRLTATVSVSVAQGQSQTGAVKIYGGSTLLATVYPGIGVLKVTLPVFRSTGTIGVKAVFAGGAKVAGSTSASIGVKVYR